MKLILDSQHRDALVAYLVQKPFGEVHAAIALLNQLPALELPVPTGEPAPMVKPDFSKAP